MAAGKINLQANDGKTLSLVAPEGMSADSTMVIGSKSGFKNYIINGGFDVWQRGTSFNENGSVNKYSADRWRSEGYPQTVTAITKTALGYKNAVSYNIGTSASNGANSLVQRIEDVRGLSGKTVTYSGRIKGDGNFNINLQIDGASQAFAVTPVEQVFSMTTQLGDTTANPYITTRFQFPSGTTGTIIITDVQLEVGSVATDFEYRSYGEELALCQRYYFVSGNIHCGQSGANVSVGYSTYFSHSWTLPVTMRATPTVLQNITVTTNSYGVQNASTSPSTYSYNHGNMSGDYSYWSGQFILDAEL